MGKRILIIDDDPLVLKSLNKMLSKKGYEVICAKSGKEAEDHLSENSANLIICDIRMPEEDGVEVMKNLKESCKNRGVADVPFLFITGYASEDAPIDAIKLGAKDYILKPFDMDEVLASVANHITD